MIAEPWHVHFDTSSRGGAEFVQWNGQNVAALVDVSADTVDAGDKIFTARSVEVAILQADKLGMKKGDEITVRGEVFRIPKNPEPGVDVHNFVCLRGLS